MQHGDARFAYQAAQVLRVLVPMRTCHDQLRAGQQRQEKFPDRDVETERGFLQNAVIVHDVIFVLRPQEPVHYSIVLVHYALGHAGRAGGVDHISEMVRTQSNGGRIGIGIVQ